MIASIPKSGCITLFTLYDRYIDMIANPEVADTFRKRAKVGYLFIYLPTVM